MTPAISFDILDLRHFKASSLRPVLESEAEAWSERLHWDYRASVELLLQYLDSRVLPGYVAVDNNQVVGYIFCVYEGNKAVIGDVFADPSYSAAEEVENSLVRHLLELLTNTPHVDRIESQLLLHPHSRHEKTFSEAGFTTYRRLFMEKDLSTVSPAPPAFSLPTELRLHSWREEEFAPAGELITEAYRGHLDGLINDQYRSLAGSLRFLHNIVRFPGCGQFDYRASRVLAQAATPDLAGLMLCSRVREDVGHITQICLTPKWRGQGLGGMLLDDAASNLAGRGFKILSLTVTEENRKAVRLYHAHGYRAHHAFDAMVWERPGINRRFEFG